MALLLAAILSAGCAENSGPDPFNQNTVTRLPVVVSDPASGATGVDIRKTIVVSFPAAVDPATIIEENIILQEASRTQASTRLVDRTFVFDAGRREVSIFPRNPLKPNTPYQIIIQGVRTPEGTVFETTTFNFTTGPVTAAPTARGFLVDPQGRRRPLADAANVDIRSNIEIVFSRSMDPASVTTVFNLSPRVAGTFGFDPSNTTLTFTHPGQPFALGEAFVVMVGADARDATPERNRLGANFVARFTTPAVGQFRVTGTIPTQQTPVAQAQADAPVQIAFGEPVDRASAQANIQFQPAAASPVLTFASNDQVVIINHANLPANTPVTVTIGANLTNTVGVTLGQASGGRDFVLEYVIEAVPPQLAAQNPTIPANDARDVSPSTRITFNFNERLDPATVNTTTFTVTRGGSPITGAVALSPSGQSVVFTPATTIRADPNPVVATATTGIRDLGGTALANNTSISFFIDNTSPQLAFTDPTNGATEVPVDRFQTQPIVVDFSEPVDQAATRRGFSIAPSRPTPRTGGNGNITFGSATRMLYTTNGLLLGNTQYTVRISTADLAGNPTPAPLVFAFTTDSTPPQVNTGALVPPPGAQNQLRQPVVSIEFTERMDLESLRNSFSLTSQGQRFGTTNGTLLFGEVGSNPARTTLSYQLNTGVLLPANAVVNINIAGTATDLGLTPIQSPFLSTFSTGP